MNVTRARSPLQNDLERRPLRRAALGLLTISLLLLTSLGAAQGARAVIVAEHPVVDSQVKEALAACQAHAAHLPFRECLDQFWIPRWLLDAAAQEEKLQTQPALQQDLADLLSVHLMEALAEQIAQPTEDEVRSYLKAHPRDFNKPLRIRIFRILVSTEEQASSLLASLQPTTKIQEFRDLARQHSVDRATNERGGDLGFVWPDGHTDIPQVSADPNLYRAALELQDGEFAKRPIAEGQRFAVVWRRGSLPPVEVDDDARAIARLRLREQRATAATDALLNQLKEQHVTGRSNEPLAKLRRGGVPLFKEP